MKKLLAVLMATLLLCGSFAIFPASAENKLVFLPKYSETGYTDGGYWANDTVKCESNGDEGLKMTGYSRSIWVFTDSVVEKMPFLILEVESGLENLTRVTGTHNFLSFKDEKDIDISGLSSGTICINMLEFLEGEDSPYAATYIAFYVGTYGEEVEKEVVLSKMYMSDTDLEGNVYIPPTQPPVPLYPSQYEVRKQLPIAAEQIVPGEGEDGTKMGQFLIADHVNIKPINDGKGMEMSIKEDSGLNEGNVAWVFPYEWLEECPYLVLEIGNEGRSDEGPKTTILSYWEGVTAEEGGKYAKLQDVEGTVGANKYNGVNRWTLKFSLDEIDQQYKDKHDGASIADLKGLGIAIQLFVGVDPSDGTTYDPLIIKDAYLLGYKDVEGVPTLVPGQETTATTTAAGDAAEDSEFPIVPVAIAAAAVIVIAAVVVIVMKKKK